METVYFLRNMYMINLRFFSLARDTTTQIHMIMISTDDDDDDGDDDDDVVVWNGWGM